MRRVSTTPQNSQGDQNMYNNSKNVLRESSSDGLFQQLDCRRPWTGGGKS